MREIARAQQGFFPTPTRIVRSIAGLLKPANHVTILDAGAGTGQAIHDMRAEWLRHHPDLRVQLLGIESDKARYEEAATQLDATLWSPIEDAYPDGPVSLLWFNPPYDRIRGAGRTELALFNKVKDWPAKSTGLLLKMVPDYVLSDAEVGLATAVERDYELLGLWRFPEPEYSDFNQCVLLARRREKALNKTRLIFPRWASNPSLWPVLSDNPKPIATLQPVRNVTLRRSKLSAEILRDTTSRSPLHGALLREAMSSAPPIGRPLLPLKHGHLALALAGGLCDGVVEANGKRFLIKGTLSSAVRKTGSKESVDASGMKIADIDVYKTRYEMNVRCLLENGTIEDYTSAELT